jgi:hypothetical protein
MTNRLVRKWVKFLMAAAAMALSSADISLAATVTNVWENFENDPISVPPANAEVGTWQTNTHIVVYSLGGSNAAEQWANGGETNGYIKAGVAAGSIGTPVHLELDLHYTDGYAAFGLTANAAATSRQGQQTSAVVYLMFEDANANAVQGVNALKPGGNPLDHSLASYVNLTNTIFGVMRSSPYYDHIEFDYTVGSISGTLKINGTLISSRVPLVSPGAIVDGVFLVGAGGNEDYVVDNVLVTSQYTPAVRTIIKEDFENDAAGSSPTNAEVGVWQPNTHIVVATGLGGSKGAEQWTNGAETNGYLKASETVTTNGTPVHMEFDFHYGDGFAAFGLTTDASSTSREGQATNALVYLMFQDAQGGYTLGVNALKAGGDPTNTIAASYQNLADQTVFHNGDNPFSGGQYWDRIEFDYVVGDATGTLKINGTNISSSVPLVNSGAKVDGVFFIGAQAQSLDYTFDNILVTYQPATPSTTIVQEDFENDTVGVAPANAEIGVWQANTAVEVVGPSGNRTSNGADQWAGGTTNGYLKASAQAAVAGSTVHFQCDLHYIDGYAAFGLTTNAGATSRAGQQASALVYLMFQDANGNAVLGVNALKAGGDPLDHTLTSYQNLASYTAFHNGDNPFVGSQYYDRVEFDYVVGAATGTLTINGTNISSSVPLVNVGGIVDGVFFVGAGGSEDYVVDNVQVKMTAPPAAPAPTGPIAWDDFELTAADAPPTNAEVGVWQANTYIKVYSGLGGSQAASQWTNGGETNGYLKASVAVTVTGTPVHLEFDLHYTDGLAAIGLTTNAAATSRAGQEASALVYLLFQDVTANATWGVNSLRPGGLATNLTLTSYQNLGDYLTFHNQDNPFPTGQYWDHVEFDYIVGATNGTLRINGTNLSSNVILRNPGGIVDGVFFVAAAAQSLDYQVDNVFISTILPAAPTPPADPFSTWQFNYFSGGSNNSNAAASADPDGDGMSNTNEFLAGFNPTNNTARLKIISIVNVGSDISVTYLGASGDGLVAPGPKTNVLESSSGTATGSYTNAFVSTGQTNILSGGTGVGVITNMIDAGGATNKPSRYYRVRVLTQ